MTETRSRAMHLRWEKRVAVKVMSRGLADTREALARFRGLAPVHLENAICGTSE